MFLGQFRSFGDEEEDKSKKPQKAPASEEFLGSTEAKEFIRKWSGQEKDGKMMYTKRGITELLRELYRRDQSSKETLKSAGAILKMLGGMDGLQGFLAGWKAKSEGLMKGLKGILGK
ncbi:hypothetical protein HZC07_01890 [Candidatus Micrarchaeota archaeon]|nr:hypothetical protein [Candidatus Micrarchaeota archaeon]